MEPTRPLDPDQLMTQQEAATLLAVQPDTLAQWRNRGQGPAFRKLGKAIRYRRGDLIAYSDARVCTNTVEARQHQTA